MVFEIYLIYFLVYFGLLFLRFLQIFLFLIGFRLLFLLFEDFLSPVLILQINFPLFLYDYYYHLMNYLSFFLKYYYYCQYCILILLFLFLFRFLLILGIFRSLVLAIVNLLWYRWQLLIDYVHLELHVFKISLHLLAISYYYYCYFVDICSGFIIVFEKNWEFLSIWIGNIRKNKRQIWKLV